MSEHHTDNATPQLSVTQSLGDLNRQDRTNLDRGLALGVRVYTILVVLTGLTWPVGNVLGMKLFSHPAMFVWMQLLLLFPFCSITSTTIQTRHSVDSHGTEKMFPDLSKRRPKAQTRENRPIRLGSS